MTVAVVAILIVGAAILAALVFGRTGVGARVADDPESVERLARESRERVRDAQTDIQRDRGRGWPL
jgi:hypothetical protein